MEKPSGGVGAFRLEVLLRRDKFRFLWIWGDDAHLLNVDSFGELIFIDIAWRETGNDIAEVEVKKHTRSASENLQTCILFAMIDVNVDGS